jgi:dihydroxyacetone kinase DhaKLM complex PTS-EIIA-like component DhaM
MHASWLDAFLRARALRSQAAPGELFESELQLFNIVCEALMIEGPYTANQNY